MIRLQIQFDVADSNRTAFEDMYKSVYLPALRRQEGFIGSCLLRRYPAHVLEEIGAAQVPYSYQLDIDFDTEDNRRHWAESDDHQLAFPQAIALATSAQACGYDVLESDVR